MKQNVESIPPDQVEQTVLPEGAAPLPSPPWAKLAIAFCPQPWQGSGMRLVLALLLGSTVVFPQDTWNGLRFGMTEDEARSALQGRALRGANNAADEPSNKGDRYTPIDVTDVQVGEDLKGIANLVFSRATKRLEQIVVTIRFQESASPNLRDINRRVLIDQLSSRYDNPVVRYFCPGKDCTSIWIQGGQVIKMTSLRKGAVGFRGAEYYIEDVFIIEYGPAPPKRPDDL
jgi:hypothetical protein